MNGGGAERLTLSFALAALAAPLLVLVHELGHAAVGLARTEGLVEVRVGASPARWRVSAGCLRLQLNPIPAPNAPAGLARVHARFGVGTKVALVLAGPGAEAAVAVLLIATGARLHVLTLIILGALGTADAALNLVPFALPRRQSGRRRPLGSAISGSSAPDPRATRSWARHALR